LLGPSGQPGDLVQLAGEKGAELLNVAMDELMGPGLEHNLTVGDHKSASVEQYDAATGDVSLEAPKCGAERRSASNGNAP
jgi:hypothetical protein